MLCGMRLETAIKRAAVLWAVAAATFGGSSAGGSGFVPAAAATPTSIPFEVLRSTGPNYTPSWPMQKERPFQIWNPIGPSAEGLLVTSRTSAGPVIDLSTVPFATPEPPGNPGRAPSTYLFVEGNASPWAVYFHSAGEGFNFLNDWQVPTSNGVQLFNAAAFEPATPNPWGLNLEAHIVSVQVNGGNGSPGTGPHFVVTDAKILNGSARTPIEPTLSLAEGAVLWKHWLSARKASILIALNRADKLTPGVPYGPETTLIRTGISPTWDSAAQELRIRFYEQRERYSRTNSCVPSPSVRCHGADVRSYGVEMAIELRFDRKGKLVGRTNRPPLASPGIVNALRP